MAKQNGGLQSRMLRYYLGNPTPVLAWKSPSFLPNSLLQVILLFTHWVRGRTGPLPERSIEIQMFRAAGQFIGGNFDTDAAHLKRFDRP